jgi:aromatase
MPTSGTRHAAHSITVRAPAVQTYRLIAEAEQWPHIFPPTVHVDLLGREGEQERLQIWAMANDQLKTWTSRRWLDPAVLRVEFRQEASQSPVAEMAGAWLVEPVTDTQCEVHLEHDYRAVDDDPDSLEWIRRAVDRNSTAELSALKTHAELASGATDLRVSFADTVDVRGGVQDVYDFLNEAQRWVERLPHVAKAVLWEDSPGVQLLDMDTRTKDGAIHSTRSVRLTFPCTRIVYKQMVAPALLTSHCGAWLLCDNGSSVRVTSKHTVVLNPANIAGVLGDSADVADARRFVRTALSANSLVTLQHAKQFAEQH